MHRLDSATRTRREKTLLLVRTYTDRLRAAASSWYGPPVTPASHSLARRLLPRSTSRRPGAHSQISPWPAPPKPTARFAQATTKRPMSACPAKEKPRPCGKKRAHNIGPSLPALPIAPVRASPHRQSPAPDSARLCSGDRWVADTTSRRPSQPRHPQSGQTCRRSERRCRRPRPLA